jgi:hypothetical protein
LTGELAEEQRRALTTSEREEAVRSMSSSPPSLSALAVLTGIAAAQAVPSCRTFEATVLLRATKEGCASPVELCTTGTVESSDPSLSGATWFFTASGTAPSAGLPATLQPVSMLSYAGSVLVTTPRDGTLTTSNAGVFDTAEGAFVQLDRITGGTGKLAGAVGRHIVTTATGGGDTGFKADIRGELCLNP